MQPVYANIQLSEQKPFTASIKSPDGGSFIVSSASWSLFNAIVTLVSSQYEWVPGTVILADQDVTGSGPTPLDGLPGAWINFCPSSYSVLAGQYILVIEITGTGSDGLERIYEVGFRMTVKPDGSA